MQHKPPMMGWKLFFYFPKKDETPTGESRGTSSFPVQTLLVRCGFQSPATQEITYPKILGLMNKKEAKTFISHCES
jgi:hypothetical protein